MHCPKVHVLLILHIIRWIVFSSLYSQGVHVAVTNKFGAICPLQFVCAVCWAITDEICWIHQPQPGFICQQEGYSWSDIIEMDDYFLAKKILVKVAEWLKCWTLQVRLGVQVPVKLC